MIDLIAGPNTEVSWLALPARRYFWQRTRANFCKSHLWYVHSIHRAFSPSSRLIRYQRCSILRFELWVGEIRLPCRQWAPSHLGEKLGNGKAFEASLKTSEYRFHGLFLVTYWFSSTISFKRFRFLTHRRLFVSRDFAIHGTWTARCK